MNRSLLAAGVAAILGMASATQAQMRTGAWVGVEGAYEDHGHGLDGITAGASAGYDFVFGDHWLVGGAVRGTFESVDNTEEVTTGALFVRTRTENEDPWGLSARFGRIFATRWLAFAQLEYDRFDRLVTVTRNAEVCVPPTIDCITTARTTSKENLWSGGVGLEYAATDNLRLRAAYSYGEHGDEKRDRAGITLAWAF